MIKYGNKSVSTIIGLIVFSYVILPPAASGASTKQRRIVVATSFYSDVAQEEASLLEKSLEELLQSQGGYDVMTGADRDMELFKGKGRTAPIYDSDLDIRQWGRGLAADVVVAGNLTRTNGQFIANFNTIDVHTGLKFHLLQELDFSIIQSVLLSQIANSIAQFPAPPKPPSWWYRAVRIGGPALVDGGAVVWIGYIVYKIWKSQKGEGNPLPGPPQPPK